VNVSVPLLAPSAPIALSSRLGQLPSGLPTDAFSTLHCGSSSVLLPHFSPPSPAAGLLSVDSAFQSVIIPDVPYVLGPACSLVTGYPTPSGKFVFFLLSLLFVWHALLLNLCMFLQMFFSSVSSTVR
jgi:hypothetical protein